MAPLVRTGGSRHTGLAALPHHNNQKRYMEVENVKMKANQEKSSQRKLGFQKIRYTPTKKSKMCMGSEVLARIGLLYKDAIPYLLYGDDADAKVVIPELLLNLSELTIEQQRYMLAALNNVKKVYMS